MRHVSLFLAMMLLALFKLTATDAAPKPNVEIHWDAGVSPSGHYVLSSLVNRKAKTWGWTHEIGYSPPIFSEFAIQRDGSKYLFAAGDSHELMVFFQIEGMKLEGNPCNFAGNKCISRLRIIDKDTFAILVNGKESTFYRVDGMAQISSEGNRGGTDVKVEISASEKKNMEKVFHRIVASMMTQLRAENIEGALVFFVESRKDKHREMFKAMKDNDTLKAFVTDGFIDVEIESIEDHRAECSFNRKENGEIYSYPIKFMETAKDIWKIYDF